MGNLIDEDIWKPEPTLRPEDEMILRKLHEMLQSTADDLKLLSGELAIYRQPGVQYKATPAPLDEAFNEKVHIEQVVNAKFYGRKIIDKTRVPDTKPNVTNSFKKINIKPKVKCSGVQVNSVPVSKRLSLSRTRVIQIDEDNIDKSTCKKKLNNGKTINEINKVMYNEYSYKYDEPKAELHHIPLQVQKMPSIDIRSELKEQKVLQIDIIPVNNNNNNGSVDEYKNIRVDLIQHETDYPELGATNKESTTHKLQYKSNQQPAVRKISKINTSNSSSGSNNINSGPQSSSQKCKRLFNSPKINARDRHSSIVTKNKKEMEKRQRLNLEEWKKKLNTVYSTSKSHKHKANVKKSRSNEKSIVSGNHPPTPSNIVRNTEYIPYSRLTLGGVRVCDIEREVSDMEDKNNIPLSPIINKILISRENSFIKRSPKKSNEEDQRNILTTSDENLLQEVIDIEKTISETLSKNIKSNQDEPVIDHIFSNLTEDERASYEDDFEEDKSDVSGNHNKTNENIKNPPTDKLLETIDTKPAPSTIQAQHNITYTRELSLAVKDSVDIFEFIHSIDTQDIAVQSSLSKITPKETQTSPRNAKQNIQPIHNDLWSPIDPGGEIKKMLTLEKEFIKKVIIEEYGEILEKSLNKPSTSQEEDIIKNIAAFQKNTQTSPARVKHVMTSPTRTKTRTTSPLLVPLIDHQTSPMVVIDQPEPNIDDDLAISINLSSPRFNLRLPQNSRDVISNLESSREASKFSLKPDKQKYSTKTSTSSIDADNSSSELSSLGEVRLKLRKFSRKAPAISEFSDSSSNYHSDYQTASILPLRSDGEVSLGQINKKSRKNHKSDGETSFIP